MLTVAQKAEESGPFEEAEGKFEEMVRHLASQKSRTLRHEEAEEWVWKEGMELMRCLYQGWLDSVGPGVIGGEVEGSDGVTRKKGRVRARKLMSVFGEVEVKRAVYGAKGHSGLFPLEAKLNLPENKYSHGLRRKVSEAAATDSFDDILEGVQKETGANIPKRQLEELVRDAAEDVEEFFEAKRKKSLEASGDDKGKPELVVGTFDGKGIVMRPESLREATRKAGEGKEGKLKHRLGPGEKKNRKREASVAAVYEIEPYKREPYEVVSSVQRVRESLEEKRPEPENKIVWASVAKPREEVVGEMLEEMHSRDPEGERRWVVLVDGLKHPIDLIEARSKEMGAPVTIILDLYHVLTYLWSAAQALRGASSPEAEELVTDWLWRILNGTVSKVAGSMKQAATLRGLDEGKRAAVDKCARYLLKYKQFLRYDLFLEDGLPIATGVIEGACRYLVKDRMERTGARWSLEGAEAVLKLRALKTNGDFDEYWAFHFQKLLHANHLSKYSSTSTPNLQNPHPHLTLVN